MTLRPSRAASFRASTAAAAAAASRASRHAARAAICSSSAAGSTVMKPPSAPWVSGEGAESVKTLTPTTGDSPDSTAATRAPFDSTRACFM